jgi:ligand-binding SRPBCC domain-containing protein
MMRFRHIQNVAASVERTSTFFHDVRNLIKLTPPYPAFTWNSVIERVESDGSFTDTFHGVMFRHWKHTHRFIAEGAGCRVIDEIECEPVWWFRPFAGLFLKALFGFRQWRLPAALA